MTKIVKPLIGLLIDQILSRSSKNLVTKSKILNTFFIKELALFNHKKTFKILNKIHSLLDKNKNLL